MKLDDKNIDQLFRDAAQNKPAPEYRSSYWNDVASVLNNEQRRKKALLFWSLGGSVTFIGLLSLLFVGIQPEDSSPRYTQGSQVDVQIAQHDADAVDLESNSNSLDQTAGQTTTSSRNDQFKEGGYKVGPKQKNINTNGSNKSNVANKRDFEEVKTPRQENGLKKPVQLPISEIPSLQLGGEVARLPVKPQYGFEPIALQDEITLLKNRFQLTAELNLGVMENYKTSRPFDSGLFSFAVKGSYTNNNVFVSSGLGLQVSTNSDLVISRRAKYYGFGVENHQTDLSYQNMYDVYVPLEIGYIQNRTKFGMGLQASYLVNTSMELSKYKDNELISSEKIRGFSNGLNKFSAQGYVWLNHSVTQRVSLGIRVGTNFTNRIKEGDYFNESATTNPIFGQLSIQYHIFK